MGAINEMKTLLYKPKDKECHRKVGEYLWSLEGQRETQKGKKEIEYIITVKENRPIRSLSANAYYHVILNLIAIHSGQGTGDQKFDHDELHELMKKKFNGTLKNLPKGGTEVIGRSTSQLDTKEFGAFVNKVKKWAIDEWGLSIPEPGDVDRAKWLEIEMEYEKTFSGY